MASKPVFSDLFTLSGRRNRKSYFLYSLLVWIVLTVVWSITFAIAGDDSTGPWVIAGVISFALGLSSWIVGAQRCRDFGWTGWAILLTLVPVVGWLFPFVMLFLPGDSGPNRYGSDPLAAT
jgi:uncharacterized membrane protein YhaH (DUF805 family)